ncbi:MAG: 16S rRNA (cytosine(1402)-N(4))-methyltransferase RsmH [Candidatus Eiseniibacteriota bacterium]
MRDAGGGRRVGTGRGRQLSVHRPVLVSEVVSYLVTDSGGIFVDGTVGASAGHARAILDVLDQDGRLVGLDRDPAAIAAATMQLERFGERAVLVQARASLLSRVLAERGIGKIDGVLLDLGMSSDQLASSRGFSFDRDGVLDLRFDAREDRPAAHELIATLDAEELAQGLTRYGDFSRREAGRLARRLLAGRESRGLTQVGELRALLDPVLLPHRRARTLARLFQCLRIMVNDELQEVELALKAAVENLRVGGILCVISYHSIEDRLVKRFMRPVPPPRRDLPPPPGWNDVPLEVLFRRPVRPGARETAENPRARSARLRVARRK